MPATCVADPGLVRAFRNGSVQSRDQSRSAGALGLESTTVSSNERSGLSLKGRGQAQAVWVDLTLVLGRADGAATGIVTDRPAAGGLSRWLRTADGAWSVW